MLSLPLRLAEPQAPLRQENGPQFGGAQEPNAGMGRMVCCEGRWSVLLVREERMLWYFWDNGCLDPCQNLCGWLVPAHLWREL